MKRETWSVSRIFTASDPAPVWGVAGGFPDTPILQIPLPPRPKPWPKILTDGRLSRYYDDQKNEESYYGVLAPDTTDLIVTKVHSKIKFLIDQGAESALTKLTALMLGGRIAPIVGGILTLLVPSDVAQTYVWKSTTRDGAAVTFVVTGFNL
jgi:hypothetical protein